MRSRRNPRPLFSSLTTSTRPIIAVDATWVPPSAWTSRPAMSTMRTSAMSSGRRLVAVRMMSGIPNASARGSVVARIARSAAISTLTASVTRSLNPGGTSGRSKSIRAVSGSMLPPVTSAPKSRNTTAVSTCRPLWVRMSCVRRSSSSAPRTGVPTGGTGSPSAGTR